MRVKNRSWTPRILALQDRRIALAARGTVEIDGQDFESPEVQRLIADGSLFVLPQPQPAEASPEEAPPGEGSEAGNPK